MVDRLMIGFLGCLSFSTKVGKEDPSYFGEDWDLDIGNPNCNVTLNCDVYIDICAQFVYTCVYIYMHELFVRAWIHVWDDVHGKHLVQNSQSKGRCNGISIACLHVGVEFSKNLCSIHIYTVFHQFFSISTCFQQAEVRMSTGWISDSQRFEEELEMAVLPYKARGSLQLVSWFPGPKIPKKAGGTTAELGHTTVDLQFQLGFSHVFLDSLYSRPHL